MISSIEAQALRRLREKVRRSFGLARCDMGERRRLVALLCPPST
jgi:hypothetical protein